jgi:hypothetical protein
MRIASTMRGEINTESLTFKISFQLKLTYHLLHPIKEVINLTLSFIRHNHDTWTLAKRQKPLLSFH